MRQAIGDLVLAGSNALHPLPPGRWLRRRLTQGLDWSQVDVPLERAGPDLHGLKIAYVSDLHAGHCMGESDIWPIFERLAWAEPDMVVLGGDLIERHAEEILLLGKALTLLRPRLGIFAVPGNHDYDADPELRLWQSLLEEHGVEILINRGRRLMCGGESLWVAGVDDLSRGHPDLPAALRGAREEEPILLLSHHPDFFCEASHAGVDLTLSGHTHGGQIMLLGRTPLHHTRLGYWGGRFEAQGAQLYVGRGIGTTWLPIRWNAPGELPVIRLLG